jgi:ferredoxin
MFYFSGTGNSKYIAELFNKDINAKCYSIEEQLDFVQLITLEEVIGFCYPIYGSRVPRIMREFAIKYMEFLKNKKIIIFCTQLIFSGDGARAFVDIFPRKHFEVIYADHILMPNNVCNLFFLPIENEKKIKKYIVKAEKKIKNICININNNVIKKRGFNIFSRILGLPQGMFMPIIEKKSLNKVWIDNDCSKCGLCINICPMKNLEFINGNITHKSNCTICYRCINMCPKKAIMVFLQKKVIKQYKGLFSMEVVLKLRFPNNSIMTKL